MHTEAHELATLRENLTALEAHPGVLRTADYLR